MEFLAHIIVWLNMAANALGSVLLAPIAVLPGWLSATVLAAVTGVVMLYVFKYTSNQKAIKRVRDDIKANLFALKLFKENTAVTLQAQGRLFLDAFWLLVYALVPMVVMIVPVLLILGQMALWYQQRPLRIGEDAVVTVKLAGAVDAPMPEVTLKPIDAIEVTTGPVRVPSERAVFWKITAKANGYQHLAFQADGQTAEKELAIGTDFMRVSTLKPSWNWSEALLNPWEYPFSPEATVQSIEIEYPDRSSWTSGTDSWVIYWFVVSMIAALFFRKALNVNI